MDARPSEDEGGAGSRRVSEQDARPDDEGSRRVSEQDARPHDDDAGRRVSEQDARPDDAGSRRVSEQDARPTDYDASRRVSAQDARRGRRLQGFQRHGQPLAAEQEKVQLCLQETKLIWVVDALERKLGASKKEKDRRASTVDALQASLWGGSQARLW